MAVKPEEVAWRETDREKQIAFYYMHLSRCWGNEVTWVWYRPSPKDAELLPTFDIGFSRDIIGANLTRIPAILAASNTPEEALSAILVLARMTT